LGSYTKGLINSADTDEFSYGKDEFSSNIYGALDHDLSILHNSNITNASGENTNIILAGDFNGRIGKSAVMLVEDEDLLAHPSDFSNNDCRIVPRLLEDGTLNSVGKHFLSLMNASGMTILNGFFGATSGLFTCQKYNGSFVVDYACVTDKIFEGGSNISVIEFKVLQKLVMMSDHCPIGLWLSSAGSETVQAAVPPPTGGQCWTRVQCCWWWVGR